MRYVRAIIFLSCRSSFFPPCFQPPGSSYISKHHYHKSFRSLCVCSIPITFISFTTLISHHTHFSSVSFLHVHRLRQRNFPGFQTYRKPPHALAHFICVRGSPFNQRLGRLFHDPLMHIQLFSGSPGNSLFHSR